MHDLQTIRFLNSDTQLAKHSQRVSDAEQQAKDLAARIEATRVALVGDLHDAVLEGLYDTESVTVGDMQPAVDALRALYDMAVKGGAK